MVHMWSRLFQIPSDEAAKLHVNNQTAKIPNEAFIHLGNLVLSSHVSVLSFRITSHWVGRKCTFLDEIVPGTDVSMVTKVLVEFPRVNVTKVTLRTRSRYLKWNTNGNRSGKTITYINTTILHVSYVVM